MKKIVAVFVVTVIASLAFASSKTKKNQSDDVLALKNLVDTFSCLADEKDAQAQTELFTEDATVR